MLFAIASGIPTVVCSQDVKKTFNEKQSTTAVVRVDSTLLIYRSMPEKPPFAFTRLRGYALWDKSWEFHPADSSLLPPPPQSPKWVRLRSSALFPLDNDQPAFWNGAGWFRLRLQYLPDGKELLARQFTLAFQIVGAMDCYLDGSPLTSIGTPRSIGAVEQLAPFGYYHVQFYNLTLKPSTTHEFLCYYTFSPVQYQRSLGGFRTSPQLGMSIALTTPEEAEKHNQSAALFWFFFQSIIGSVVSIGIIHFLLYMGREHQPVNLIIALFTLFVTVQSLSFYFLNYALGQPLWVIFAANTVLVVAAPLSLLLVVILLKEIFGRYIHISVVFASILSVTATVLSFIRTPPGSQFLLIVNLATAICVLMLVGYVLLKVVQMYLLRVPDKGLMAWSVVLFTMSFMNEVVFSFRNEFHFRRPFWSAALMLGLYLPIPFALSVTVTRRLLSLRDKLKKSNLELEERVQERTAELTTANEEIERQLEILNEQSKEIEIANAQLQERNLELEEFDNEKNEFLGIAAHDLKNPLAAIRMAVDLMLRYRNRMTIEEQEERLHIIMTVSERMTLIISNLLEINALERGGITISPTRLDMVAIARTAVQGYEERAQAKGITLHFETNVRVGLVYADEHALVQVLDNLISNAVKYSPLGKRVVVRIRAGAETIKVEIQDEGEGISPDDMTKLFGKFARLSARPTGGEHSTGLGLSIVKKMVEAMRGRVWCESELGRGAKFIVELPQNV